LDEKTTIDGVCVDEKNKIFSTPCYMKHDAKPYEIFEGMENLVKQVAKSLKK
jgi:enhancing lycopene biosynthesis protein 2